MRLKIGNRMTVEVSSLPEASAIYCKARDESGEGGSTFPNGRIIGAASGTYYVSYNGKVWAQNPASKSWMAGRMPAYNPYA